ncbi:MAG: type I-MYXAN CRISPR-associated protein Cas6/Cmx6, partial [Syntrophobacteraceae bacterium]
VLDKIRGASKGTTSIEKKEWGNEYMTTDVRIDLCFKVMGTKLPVDHGFALYGALSRVLPFVHEHTGMGVKLIRGRYVGEGLLDIAPLSELVLRIPAEHIAPFLGLAGKVLDIRGSRLSIGVPVTRALIPASALHSPLVTTRNGNEQSRFESELHRKMAELDVHGNLDIGRRRTFTVHGKQVVGYEVWVSKLTAEESIVIQEEGLGGRRKMGCGFFEGMRDL